MPELARWRGKITLSIDVEGEDDDAAMDALSEYVAPILNAHCAVTERRVALLQFVDHPHAPWRRQRVVHDAAELIDTAIEVATFTEGGDWPDASKPDLHVHRHVLEGAINRALRHNYKKGIDAEKRRNRPAIRAAVTAAESPERVSVLLEQFATDYDSNGESAEANILRDAADLVAQLAAQPKGTSNE